MVIRRNLPSADARGTHTRTLTLEDLRELVEVSGSLDGGLIVRVQAIPFHVPDLGNPLGSRCMVLTLDTEDGNGGTAPNRAARRATERGKSDPPATLRKFADGAD